MSDINRGTIAFFFFFFLAGIRMGYPSSQRIVRWSQGRERGSKHEPKFKGLSPRNKHTVPKMAVKLRSAIIIKSCGAERFYF